MQAAASDRIATDPRVCHGRPVIRGTRVPASIVTGSLAGGMTFEEVTREYGVSVDDIRAALAHQRHTVPKLFP